MQCDGPEAEYVPVIASQVNECEGQGVRGPPGQLQALDLFSGTGSVGKALSELGFYVTSVDIDPMCQGGGVQITCDVRDWDYTQYPRGYFHVIAASPPCTVYSTAYNPRPRNFTESDEIVAKTLEIIEYFQPPLWWIENPRHGLLKSREVVQGLPFLDLDYCQFSDWGYQKPTRFWCCEAIARLPPVVCNLQTCTNVIRREDGKLKHKIVLGGVGPKATTKEKCRVPAAVTKYLLSAVPGGESGFVRGLESYQKG